MTQPSLFCMFAERHMQQRDRLLETPRSERSLWEFIGANMETKGGFKIIAKCSNVTVSLVHDSKYSNLLRLVLRMFWTLRLLYR